MGWRRSPGDGHPAGLPGRVARLEAGLRRLQEAHRLLLAYVRGIDGDLADVEEALPAGERSPGRPGSGGRRDDAADRRPLIFVECAECRRTVALAEDELGAFEEALRCPYCTAELMKARKAAAR